MSHSILSGTKAPPERPRVGHEKKSDGLRVGHEKKSDGFRVGQNFKSDVPRVGTYFQSDVPEGRSLNLTDVSPSGGSGSITSTSRFVYVAIISVS